MDLIALGKRLIKLREANGFSASGLAREMGISRGYLSRVENGRQVPSMVTLDAIGQFFGVELEYFFSSDSSGLVEVQRGVLDAAGDIPEGASFAYEALCKGRRHKLAQPFIAVFRPLSRTQIANHDAEYFRFVVQGTVVLHYDGQSYRLSAGDGIYYDASSHHEIECTSDVPGKVLTIYVKPTLLSLGKAQPAVIEGHL